MRKRTNHRHAGKIGVHGVSADGGKQQLIQMLKSQTYKHDRIFNSTHDGMIFIDVNETIILFNQMAEKWSVKREDVI